MMKVDFSRAPFLVIWETTQSCDLACRHCRASAQPDPLPGELTTAEGKKLLDQVSEMGTPIMVLSGGDPLKREDLDELILHGRSVGLRMATIPAATPRLTRERMESLAKTGVDQLALSLDFPTEELHDDFRLVPGAFKKTMEAASWIRDLGIPLQINTTITKKSLPYLEEMGKLVAELGVVFWEVFFLVPMGRGTELESLTAEECESAFKILHGIDQEHSFVLKVTEAPHYRRFVHENEKDREKRKEKLHRRHGPGGSIGLAPQTINSGRGFIFVSYKGEVFPSGFLPMDCGNVRDKDIPEIYQKSDLLLSLRNSDLLVGRCGDCKYRVLCGGSRSRAHALTGNPLETDPWCIYDPAQDEAAQATAEV